MRTHVRPATLADIRLMAEIAGPPVTPEALADWMDGDSAYAAWHLVENETGGLLGFQQIGRSAALPPEACAIATFLHKRPLPPGTASDLFDATAETARLLRYGWISAEIAAGNIAAAVFYQNRGFRLYSTTITHVFMRYDLE